VHVISKRAWRRAVAADPSLEGPISEWYKVARNAAWQSLIDARKVYPHADFVDPYTVFNIKGSSYRLIVRIEYRWQMIFVKFTNARRVQQGSMEKMSGAAVNYGKLLSRTKPEVVRNDGQNRLYIRQLEELTSQKRVTAAEEKLIALLTVLVEEYEEKHYPVPDAAPLDVIRHLMDAHNLRQKDLADVFGTESIVSDVLNGRRDLAKEHIRRLSARFHVSPSVFF